MMKKNTLSSTARGVFLYESRRHYEFTLHLCYAIRKVLQQKEFMAKETKTIQPTQSTGTILVLTYFALFAVNAVVLYVANMFFPKQIVLGTMSMDTTWAIVHSMAALALIGTFALPFIRQYENSRKKMLSSMEWMVYYLILNVVGVWVITRFSDQFGLGVSGWYVVVGLAVVLDIVQGAVMMGLQKMRTE